MKKIISLSLFFTLFILASALTATPPVEKDQYLTEYLKNPTFLETWEKLIRRPDIPRWLSESKKVRPNIIQTKAIIFSAKSGDLLGFNVCKPHDCGNNEFFVLFTLDGREAWGYAPNINGKNRFYNDPDKEKQAIFPTMLRKFQGF